MMRLAVLGEENIIAERGEAERLNVLASGVRIGPFPPAGAIQMSIRARQRWYLDDDDPRTVAHAYLEDDGKVYVDWVLGPSEKEVERLKFLANDLLAFYGNRIAVYPDALTPTTDRATEITGATKTGTQREVLLLTAATALNKVRTTRGVGK